MNGLRWFVIRNNLCPAHIRLYLDNCSHFNILGDKIIISEAKDCHDCNVEKERHLTDETKEALK